MSKGNVLVTGASGFLGYHVCKYFLSQEMSVKGTDLYPFDYPDLADKVEFVQCDIRDAAGMAAAIKGVDVIVHGAAALPLWSADDIFTTNVGGTRNILQAAFDLGVKRVVYICSTAVYGIPKTHPVDENYPLHGVGPYGTSKIEAEKVCLEFRAKGLCVPILRPKTFAGPMRLGVFQILCDWVADKKNVPIIGNGKNRYQLLHIDDFVEAIYLVSTRDDGAVNDTYNVGSAVYRSVKEDLQALMDYAGFGKHIIPFPSWMVIPPLKVLEFLHLSPLYEWVYETAGEDHYVSIDKIRDRLQFVPKKSTADVWIDTYKWYIEEISRHKIGTGVTHRVAWKQGMLKLVKLFF